MAAKRHDWLKYKKDYFNSETDDLVRFFSAFNPPIKKTQYDKASRGWKEKKQEYRQKLFEGEQKKLAKDPSIIMERNKLLQGLRNAVSIVINRLNPSREGKLNMKDVSLATDILRREMGLPNVISENKNMNDTKIELGDDYKAFMRAIYADN